MVTLVLVVVAVSTVTGLCIWWALKSHRKAIQVQLERQNNVLERVVQTTERTFSAVKATGAVALNHALSASNAGSQSEALLQRVEPTALHWMWGDTPVLTLEPCGKELAAQGTDVPEGAKAFIQNLLAQSPKVALAVATSAETMSTYRLLFSPGVTQGLADGSLHLVEAVGGGSRAIAAGQTGFVEHGTLISAGASVATVAAFWQIAAVITAQAYLHSINKNLVGVGHKLDELKTILEHSRIGKLRADLDYIIIAAQALQQGDVSTTDAQAYRIQLESILRDASALTYAARFDADAEASKLEQIDMSGNWSVDPAPARELMQGFQRQLEQSFVSLQVHAIALQVGCCLGVHEDLAETRIAALEQQLSAIEAAQERFTNAMRTKIDGLSLRLRGMQKEQRSREHLHQPLTLMEHELDEARSNLVKRISGCREFLLKAKQEFQVVIETDEAGQIRTARKLLPVAKEASTVGAV